MIPYLGDFSEDDTVYHYFNTFTSDDPAASATITNLVDADLKVHKDGGTTEATTDGATISIDFDGITGSHLVTIDSSADAFYETGSDYMVRMEGTTVDGGTINAALFTFSIQNRYSAGALRPTTAGRTLDISATGEAGLDYSNVNLPAGPVPELGIIDRGTGQAATSTTFTIRAAATDDIIEPGMILWVFGSTQGYWQSVVIDSVSGDVLTIASWPNATPSGTLTYQIFGVPQSSPNLLLDVNVAQLSGDATAADNAESFFDVTGYAGTNNVIPSVTNVTGGINTGAGTITTLDGLDTAQDTQHSNTQSLVTTVDTVVDGIQTDLDNGTDGLGAIKTAVDAVSAGNSPSLLQSTTIATLASQTSFTLTAGSADDDAYNGAIAIITDQSTSTQKAVGSVSDYTGSTLTVTLGGDPGIFTMAVGDSIDIIAPLGSAGSAPTAAAIRAEIDANSTQLAAIVADTNELQSDDIPGSLSTISSTLSIISGYLDTEIAAILADTGELQGDWADGGRLDLLLDGIKAVTDALPDSGALTSIAQASALATAQTDLDTITGSDGVTLATAQGNYAPATASALATVDSNIDSMVAGIISGAAATGTLSTTQATTNLSGYADDQLIGRTITWLSGDCEGEQTDITDSANTGGLLTFTALTTAPANTDTFKIT